ncbi:MAG: hypothetical protein ABSG68_06365 [Thermoguttaceae bacterium]|jgi:archaellum component FlaF (FlaF/FlaG flagellin family)
MSEATNELKKALAENGNFDAAKADRDVIEASSYFDSQLRRGARFTFLSLIIVVAVLEFAFIGFFLTFSTKALVGFATLLVVTVVLIVRFAIGHEITNTKISLLREIKLLRLEHLGLPADQTITPPRKAAPTGTSLWRVLSLRENTAWLLAAILVAVVSAHFTLQLMNRGMTMTEESQVTLLADGSKSTVSKVSYRNPAGLFPTTSLSLWTGDGPFAITQWLDGRGRELPISVSTIGGNRKYTVQLAEPIMPGDQVNYTTTTEAAKMATRQGETWTYHGGQKWTGKGQKFFLETVQLPQGAEIVCVEPKPAQQFLRDGLPTVRFQTVVDQGHELAYTIQYRLPKETGTQKAAK